jgi:hypothetical protein
MFINLMSYTATTKHGILLVISFVCKVKWLLVSGFFYMLYSCLLIIHKDLLIHDDELSYFWSLVVIIMSMTLV